MVLHLSGEIVGFNANNFKKEVPAPFSDPVDHFVARDGVVGNRPYTSGSVGFTTFSCDFDYPASSYGSTLSIRYDDKGDILLPVRHEHAATASSKVSGVTGHWATVRSSSWLVVLPY